MRLQGGQGGSGERWNQMRPVWTLRHWCHCGVSGRDDRELSSWVNGEDWVGQHVGSL